MAVLNADTVISLADEKAVSKIVEACVKDANAGWWAEIVTRFHKYIGSGVILHDAKKNTGAVQKIESANKELAPPSFGSAAGSKTVKVYMLEPESFVVYSVTAAFQPDGDVDVTQTSIE